MLHEIYHATQVIGTTRSSGLFQNKSVAAGSAALVELARGSEMVSPQIGCGKDVTRNFLGRGRLAA